MNTNDLFTTVLGANILIKSNLLYRIFNILKFGKWYKTHVRFNKKRFLTTCLVSRVSDPEEAYASDVAKLAFIKIFIYVICFDNLVLSSAFWRLNEV